MKTLFVFDFNHRPIEVTDFQVALIWVVIGVYVGYSAMRKVLFQLVELTNANQKALQTVLSPEKLKEIGGEQNEIAILARSFSAITERLEENVKNLKLAKRTLHTVMSRVGQGISNMQNIDTFLELILETIVDGLNGKVGVLMLFNSSRDEMKIKTIYGIENISEIKEPIMLKKESYFSKMTKDKKPIAAMIIEDDIKDLEDKPKLFFGPIVISPLVVQEKVLGVIVISGKDLKEEEQDKEEEMSLLYNLASQMGVAIENSRLNEDMEATYFETISALALAVDAKDKYSRGHLDRVAHYCVMLAQKCGLNDEDKKILRDAARLHDIGKIGIPDEVLRKNGPLTDEEWGMMMKHPEIGESIIKPIRSLNHLCDIVRHHHEKLDGSGYPDGLKGDQIAKLVRITTIADIYDAVTTNRPYRSFMSKEEAISELRKMGDKLDQELVELFIETLEEK